MVTLPSYNALAKNVHAACRFFALFWVFPDILLIECETSPLNVCESRAENVEERATLPVIEDSNLPALEDRIPSILRSRLIVQAYFGNGVEGDMFEFDQVSVMFEGVWEILANQEVSGIRANW